MDGSSRIRRERVKRLELECTISQIGVGTRPETGFKMHLNEPMKVKFPLHQS